MWLLTGSTDDAPATGSMAVRRPLARKCRCGQSLLVETGCRAPRAAWDLSGAWSGGMDVLALGWPHLPPSPTLSTLQHPPCFSSDTCPVTLQSGHTELQNVPWGGKTAAPPTTGIGRDLGGPPGAASPTAEQGTTGEQDCPPRFSPTGSFLHPFPCWPPNSPLPPLSSGSLGASKRWGHVEVIRPEGKAGKNLCPTATEKSAQIRGCGGTSLPSTGVLPVLPVLVPWARAALPTHSQALTPGAFLTLGSSQER